MRSTGMTVVAACAAGVMACAVAAQESKADAATNRVAAYYFGNSLTGCSDPKSHEALGKSAGKEWKTWAFMGAGWQLWQHRYGLQHAGVEIKRDARGDLTIDPGSVEHSSGHNVKQFYSMEWDAIVLQPFSLSLEWKASNNVWGVELGKDPVEIGDIGCAADIIQIFLQLNPQGRVFIYQDWPAMAGGKIPPPDQRPEWAKKPNARIAAAEFPLREEFDYEQEWALAKYEPSNDPNKFWFQKNARSKDYHDRLFAALKERFPALWKEGRLRAIPVGDVYLALHRKMKAGEFPGCKDIGDFYADVQHIRGGLPRYTVAAAFYASLFDEHPGKLDWKLYNDETRYQPDPFHDGLPLFEITPERARAVNDTTWTVINSHPDARGGKR